jgi:MinD superfamily P-loop ATPase
MLLVLITGQKGGVGKTTFANLLANWLDRQHVVWRGVDSDAENRFFADVNKFNSLTRVGSKISFCRTTTAG